MLITSPQPELKVYFVWGSVSAVHLWTCPWVDCFSLDVSFMSKSLPILWGFFVFMCTHSLCVPESAQPLNHPVSVRNVWAFTSPVWPKKLLRVFKVNESRKHDFWQWLGLLVARRHCGQLSTTETVPEPGCAHSCLWLHCAVKEQSLVPGELPQRLLSSRALLLVCGNKAWSCPSMQSLTALLKKWLCCPANPSPFFYFFLPLLLRK